MKFRILFAALPLVGVSLWAAGPAVNDLVLPEKVYPQLDAILKHAVQQSPQMLNRALDLEMAEGNRIQARSNILPSLTTSYRYSQTSDDRSDFSGRQDLTKVYYDVTFTQPVYYWGERRNNAHIGEIQQKITQGSYRDGYRLLAQAIRQGYLDLILRKVLLERSKLAYKYNQDVLKVSEERFSKGVLSDAELFPIRLNAERATIDLERAGYDFESAKQSLARLSGTAQVDDQSIPDEIPALSYNAASFDQLLAGYLASRELPTAEADILRRQIEVENLNYLNQKTRLRPKLNFVAGMTQDEQSFSINVAQKYRVNSIYAGLQLNWTIFDGFASGAAARNALAHRRQLENDYKGLTDRLTTQAQSEVRQLNFAARSMSILDRMLAAAAAGLQTRQAEFARGVVSENDVTSMRLTYYSALIDTQNARIDYLIKVGDFLGTLAADPVLANVADNK